MPQSLLQPKPIKNITKWQNLIGSPKQFNLERRIFHSITIGLLALTTVYIPYNIYAGLYTSSVSGVVFLGIFFY